MGIDIRDGEQLECINCALCIDACDVVMKRVGLPSGLIAYDTPQNIARRTQRERAHFAFIRPRVVLYALALAAVTVVMLFGLTTRATIDLNVLRDRNPTFVRLSDGSIRNAYTVKIMNRASAERSFALAIGGPDKMAVKIVGVDDAKAPLAVESDRLRTLRVLLTVPADALHDDSMPVTFTVADAAGGEARSNRTVFLSDGGTQ